MQDKCKVQLSTKLVVKMLADIENPHFMIFTLMNMYEVKHPETQAFHINSFH